MSDEIEVKVETEAAEATIEVEAEESDTDPAAESGEDLKLTKEDLQWLKNARRQTEQNPGENQADPVIVKRIARLEVPEPEPEPPPVEPPPADRTEKTPRRKRDPRKNRKRILRFYR